jgi:hypothetical protein
VTTAVLRWRTRCEAGCRPLLTDDETAARKWVAAHAYDLMHRPASYHDATVRYATAPMKGPR